jgi:hypothetical protein
MSEVNLPCTDQFASRAMRNKRDKDREKELFDVSFGEVQASTSCCLPAMKKCNTLDMHRHVPLPALRQERLQVRRQQRSAGVCETWRCRGCLELWRVF